jgi:hypothetical protein
VFGLSDCCVVVICGGGDVSLVVGKIGGKSHTIGHKYPSRRLETIPQTRNFDQRIPNIEVYQ